MRRMLIFSLLLVMPGAALAECTGACYWHWDGSAWNLSINACGAGCECDAPSSRGGYPSGDDAVTQCGAGSPPGDGGGEFDPAWDKHWLEVFMWCFLFYGFNFGVWFGRARQTL
jgi:hypothetical protein